MSTSTARNSQHTDAHASTREMPIRMLPFPLDYVLPLAQCEGGMAAKPLVEVGQEIVRGEPIAESVGFVSTWVHAPVTGKVTKIVGVDEGDTLPPAIHIQQYTASGQDIMYGAPVNVDALSPAQILKAIQRAGINDVVDRAIPAHVKLTIADDQTVHTILVDARESHPLVAVNARLLAERAAEINVGVSVVLRTVGAAKVIYVVDSANSASCEALCTSAPASTSCEVHPLEASSNASETALIDRVLGVALANGKTAIDAGVIVMSLGAVMNIGALLPLQRGAIEQVVTVSGPGFAKPGNYAVPTGTSLRVLMDHAGYAGKEFQVRLCAGTRCTEVESLDAPIAQGTTGIVAVAPNGTASLPLHLRLKNWLTGSK